MVACLLGACSEEVVQLTALDNAPRTVRHDELFSDVPLPSTVRWSLSAPQDSAAGLSAPVGSTTTFTPDVLGIYTLTGSVTSRAIDATKVAEILVEEDGAEAELELEANPEALVARLRPDFSVVGDLHVEWRVQRNEIDIGFSIHTRFGREYVLVSEPASGEYAVSATVWDRVHSAFARSSITYPL